MFEGLLRIACDNTETGEKLRARIGASYERIARFKRARRDLLCRQVEAPAMAVDRAVALAPGAELPAGFRLDNEALARLQPELDRAALPLPLFPAFGGWVQGLFGRKR